MHVKIVHLRLNEFKCNKCFKTFNAKGNLEQHNLRIHTYNREEKCDICDK